MTRYDAAGWPRGEAIDGRIFEGSESLRLGSLRPGVPAPQLPSRMADSAAIIVTPEYRTSAPETRFRLSGETLFEVEHGDNYWEWRDELLAHPKGRAEGGEPCVQCSEPVPPNAHWKQRDRHVCSSRCNGNLARRFSRKLDKLGADGFDLPKPDPTLDPRDAELGPIRSDMVEHDDGSIDSVTSASLPARATRSSATTKPATTSALTSTQNN